MGANKASSKVAKKNSKLDSFKNLAFGSSHSSAKKSASSGSKADSHQKKEKTSAASKNQTTKTGGKTKANSSVQASSKSSGSLHAKSSSRLMPQYTSSLVSGRLDTLGETVCREVACEGLATSGGYCRLHYIKNWKKIKRKELILREKKLNQYIEELVAKYPDKYIEAIRQDLASDKDFSKVIYDLDLDEGVDDFDIEGGESVDSLIDTIKRDFDDEGDAY